LTGFRFLNLDESINIHEDIRGTSTAPEPFANQRVIVQDRFATNNAFYGAQLGAVARWNRGPWDLNLTGKVGIGGTVQSIDIDGSQTARPNTRGNNTHSAH